MKYMTLTRAGRFRRCSPAQVYSLMKQHGGVSMVTEIMDVLIKDQPVVVPGPDRVMIFDTTLRDGHALAGLGVDVIEAGFPAASRGDLEAVSAIAREVDGVTICALARCK